MRWRALSFPIAKKASALTDVGLDHVKAPDDQSRTLPPASSQAFSDSVNTQP